jgi:hypothetical protein
MRKKTLIISIIIFLTAIVFLSDFYFDFSESIYNKYIGMFNAKLTKERDYIEVEGKLIFIKNKHRTFKKISKNRTNAKLHKIYSDDGWFYTKDIEIDEESKLYRLGYKTYEYETLKERIEIDYIKYFKDHRELFEALENENDNIKYEGNGTKLNENSVIEKIIGEMFKDGIVKYINIDTNYSMIRVKEYKHFEQYHYEYIIPKVEMHESHNIDRQQLEGNWWLVKYTERGGWWNSGWGRKEDELDY